MLLYHQKEDTLMQEPRFIGVVTTAVSFTLGEEGRQYKAGDIIYLGENNIEHMKRRHSSAYVKYSDRLSQIISEPDYVGINDEDGSLARVSQLAQRTSA